MREPRTGVAAVPDLEAKERGVHWLGLIAWGREHPCRGFTASPCRLRFADAVSSPQTGHEGLGQVHTARLARFGRTYDQAMLAVGDRSVDGEEVLTDPEAQKGASNKAFVTTDGKGACPA